MNQNVIQVVFSLSVGIVISTPRVFGGEDAEQKALNYVKELLQSQFSEFYPDIPAMSQERVLEIMSELSANDDYEIKWFETSLE